MPASPRVPQSKQSKRSKRFFAHDLKVGQQVTDIFLVSRFALAETKTGKPYLALTLSDRTGDIEARLWDHAEEAAPFAQEGRFVTVTAAVEQFKGQNQLKLTRLEAADEDAADMADFIACCPRDAEEMRAELSALIAGVRHPGIRGLLERVFQGETLRLFAEAPAAKKMHHAYRGGLMEHSLSVAGLAVDAARRYPALDADLLVAGALLHDLAKIDEYDWTRPAVSQTGPGLLLGHLVLGAERIREAAAATGLDPELSVLLAHMAASHHGRREYGAAALPMTAEAVVLHYLDQIDAKMNAVAALQDTLPDDAAGPQWTPYQLMFESALYLKKPVPAPEGGAAVRIGPGDAPPETPVRRPRRRKTGDAPPEPEAPPAPPADDDCDDNQQLVLF